MQKYLFVSICILFFACSVPEYNTVPPDVIPKEKMVGILYDMHLAEGVIAIYPSKGDSNARRALGYYEIIYKKHSTTKEEFKKSYDFYIAHPVLMDSVYTNMIEKLNEKELLLRK
ncbi:MAG: DUF4296 domain-containing protein [Bacteroidota bacterium]